MKIQINVYVSATDAAKSGSVEHGELVVEPTAEQWAGASEEQRLALVDYRAGSGYTRHLKTTSPAWDAVLVAIDTVIAEREAEAATKAAESEERIQRALAAPDKEWVGSDSRAGYYVVGDDGEPSTSGGYTRARPTIALYPGTVYLPDEQRRDPRIVAHRERLERDVLPPLVAEWERRYAEWQAWTEARTAERKAEEERAAQAKADCEAGLRMLAAREDDLSRAATEGYAVTKAMLDRLADRLADRVGRDRVVEIDSRTWGESAKDRAAPRPEAFALRDAVEAAAREENEALPRSLGARWVVSRIVRVDVGEGDETRRVTAVLATLETPCGVREITFSPESMENTDAE